MPTCEARIHETARDLHVPLPGNFSIPGPRFSSGCLPGNNSSGRVATQSLGRARRKSWREIDQEEINQGILKVSQLAWRASVSNIVQYSKSFFF
jgi:hypothetical protein